LPKDFFLFNLDDAPVTPV